jgi:hypothetical protein
MLPEISGIASVRPEESAPLVSRAANFIHPFRIHSENKCQGTTFSRAAEAVKESLPCAAGPRAAERSDKREPKNEPRLLKRAQSKRMLWEWQSLQSIVS